MKTGSPPTPRKARTGELTPPGIDAAGAGVERRPPSVEHPQTGLRAGRDERAVGVVEPRFAIGGGLAEELLRRGAVLASGSGQREAHQVVGHALARAARPAAP